MSNKFKFLIGKIASKSIIKGSKFLPYNGKSYPGYMFTKICGIDSINDLKKEQLQNGSVIITGTNGKTTTTTMIHDLLEKDLNLCGSRDNNTIYATTTALLEKKGDLGVFEYGIRDFKHGIPETMAKVMDPIGVIYTNISREHTQVAHVKNPFEDYVAAKSALSKNMKNGIVITNADDPRTNFIGNNKEKDGKVIYYGLDIDYTDIFDKDEIKCPKCGKILNYSKIYMNQRGIYTCDCGFTRNEPNIKISNIEVENNKWKIKIEGNVYNFHTKKNIKINVNVNIPMFGLYNLYNILCSTATYACFTTKTENIESNIKQYFNSLTLDVLPAGRFELIKKNNKLVGMGQGDNGDALIANCTLMNMNIKDEFEFIYTTPDDFEDEIFQDHKRIIKGMNPHKLTVVPGRVSSEAAEKYYNELKKDFPNAEFHPIKNDLKIKIDKLYNLINESKYRYILVTGCGDEYKFWDLLKEKIEKG